MRVKAKVGSEQLNLWRRDFSEGGMGKYVFLFEIQRAKKLHIVYSDRWGMHRSILCIWKKLSDARVIFFSLPPCLFHIWWRRWQWASWNFMTCLMLMFPLSSHHSAHHNGHHQSHVHHQSHHSSHHAPHSSSHHPLSHSSHPGHSSSSSNSGSHGSHAGGSFIFSQFLPVSRWHMTIIYLRQL